MKQYRTTDQEKINIVKRYLDGETTKNLSLDYKISQTAILGLLKRRGIKIRVARKYQIDETFFDKIDTEERAYFLGFLYADGYNNTDRNAVALSLKEDDKKILIKLNRLLQPNKPLQYVKIKTNNSTNQYRLVIANKHISQRLVELGCDKAKTFKITFPDFLDNDLIPHFIRGYFDGDGWIGIVKKGKSASVCIVGTVLFCERLADILKNKIDINCYIRPRHKERKNNIRQLEISGINQVKKFINFIYDNSNIYLKRKKNKSKKVMLINNKYERCYAAKNILAQVQRELNLKNKRGWDSPVKPVELSSVDEAVKQEATRSLA